MVLRLVMGSCEHGTEPSGSVKDGEFFDWSKEEFLPRSLLIILVSSKA